MAKLCILYGNSFSSKLTQFFTGSKAYHVYWQTDTYIYEMHLLRVRRQRSQYDDRVKIEFNFPGVTDKYLEEQLTDDANIYGFIDYLLFALRPFYHLIGKSSRNHNGEICSEACNNDLRACGYETPWLPEDAPPSPADIERWLNK